jgi:hypothetical protein
VKHSHRRTWLAFLCLWAVGGCADFAVQPPTPARKLPVNWMWEPQPGHRFYVIVFGSESTPRIPRFTHTWATFIHVTDPGAGRERKIESHTISWMPATLEIHPWNFRVEPPVNFGLHETLVYAFSVGERVAQWGPYECRPQVYYRSLVQKEFLESGRIGYQCIDTVGEAGRKGNGCDCIHAVTDMDPVYSRSRYRLIRFGNAASRFIAGELRVRDMLLNPSQTHDWLNRELGLDAYPITHRLHAGWRLW